MFASFFLLPCCVALVSLHLNYVTVTNLFTSYFVLLFSDLTSMMATDQDKENNHFEDQDCSPESLIKHPLQVSRF